MMQGIKAVCPKLAIPEKVWKKLLAYIDACPMEVGGLGSVERQGDRLVITDVFLLEQKVSPVSTLPTARAIPRFLTDWVRQGKDPAVLKFWWHSHADMNAFWSEIDLRTITELSSADYVISLVGNHRHETRTRLTLSSPVPIALDFLPIEVITEIDEAVAKAAAEEVKAKVKGRWRLPFFGPGDASPPAREDAVSVDLNDDGTTRWKDG